MESSRLGSPRSRRRYAEWRRWWPRVPFASVVRFEDEGTVVQRASYAERGVVFPSDKRWPLEGTSALAQVHAHGKPARLEDYSGTEGEIAEYVRRVGIRSTRSDRRGGAHVGSPIVVESRVWGKLVVASTQSQLAPDTESRLMAFTELLGTAVANADARRQVQRLAEEQAALRRVATLVAQDVPSSELFGAVACEVGVLLGADLGGRLEIESPAGGGTLVAAALPLSAG
jgi:GAF domain-containing protein